MENLVLFMDPAASGRPRNRAVEVSIFDPDDLLSSASAARRR
jgi:hypothetical protein